jgi:hypothetical protein
LNTKRKTAKKEVQELIPRAARAEVLQSQVNEEDQELRRLKSVRH